ncbi:MAG: sulfur carrier protein ThiS [Acetatifactor sp.]
MMDNNYFNEGDVEMQVNGEQIRVEAPLTVMALLEQQNYQPNRIAVEVNEVIVPKAQYETFMLSDCDRVEIVCFVGGG